MVLIPVGARLGVDRPERGCPLVASQILGLILVRYVLGDRAARVDEADQVVATYAPVLQRYLYGPLPGG